MQNSHAVTEIDKGLDSEEFYGLKCVELAVGIQSQNGATFLIYGLYRYW